jgi:hypothetical protein
MMISNSSLINIGNLVRNTNTRIGPLLEIGICEYEKRNTPLTYYMDGDIDYHWKSMAFSHNPTVLAFLEKNISRDRICWKRLSANECDEAIEILQRNMDKICWHSLCGNGNPKAFKLIESINPERRSINMLAKNPNAVHIIRECYEYGNTLATSTCENLSRNPNAIDFLMQYPHLIKFDCILENPNAIAYLETQLHKVTVKNIFNLLENPNCIPLVQKLMETRITDFETIMSNIVSILLDYNYESLFSLDYKEMSKVRTRNIYSELLSKALHPSRVEKWLDYHIENGGDIEDFDLS